MRRIALVLSVLLVALGASVPSRADGWTPRPAEYPGTVVQRDVRITMSDGVRLTANIIFPADASGAAVPGKFPVLLTQTPYNRDGLNFASTYMVQRGYIQVIAEVRGTGSSEGTWDSFGTREQLDGAELAEWVVKQPWSDGRTGLHGTSYGAINQLLTAAQQPTGLRAAFPIVPMADSYRDIVGSGGQVNTSFIPSWLGLVTALSMVPPTYAASDPVGAATALTSHAGGALAFQAPVVLRAMTGGDNAFDGPFYRTRSPIEVIDRVNIPTFIVGGTFDLFQRGEPMLYSRLAAREVPAKLLIGPWYHVTVGQGLPANGVRTIEQLELRWMDHYVRDMGDPTLDDDIANVTYYRLGANRYETAASWPPADVAYQERFLAGPATLGLQAGALAGSAPAAQDPDVLVWQPASGLCSRSVAQWTAAGVNQGCEVDQRSNEAGGLTYEMPAGDLSLAGPIAARLFVSTNGRDAFVTARVEDVAPDGQATQLTAGWNLVSLRALDEFKSAYADGFIVQPYHPFTRASQALLPAGEIAELLVEIYPTAARLAPGHLLRLSLQASDAPHLSPPVPQTASLAGGILYVHHDAAHPSSIVLPVQE